MTKPEPSPHVVLVVTVHVEIDGRRLDLDIKQCADLDALVTHMMREHKNVISSVIGRTPTSMKVAVGGER